MKDAEFYAQAPVLTRDEERLLRGLEALGRMRDQKLSMVCCTSLLTRRVTNGRVATLRHMKEPPLQI